MKRIFEFYLKMLKKTMQWMERMQGYILLYLMRLMPFVNQGGLLEVELVLVIVLWINYSLRWMVSIVWIIYWLLEWLIERICLMKLFLDLEGYIYRNKMKFVLIIIFDYYFLIYLYITDLKSRLKLLFQMNPVVLRFLISTHRHFETMDILDLTLISQLLHQ